MSLACGGRGPCCHVGYPHRHCEHCDVVIALVACHHPYGYQTWPWIGSYGGIGYSSPLQSQLGNSLQVLEAEVNKVEFPPK